MDNGHGTLAFIHKRGFHDAKVSKSSSDILYSLLFLCDSLLVACLAHVRLLPFVFSMIKIVFVRVTSGPK